MKWEKSLRAAGLIAVLSVGLIACNAEASYSPQEIIDQALQETNEVDSYYGEYTMDMGEIGGTVTVKEWVKDGKRRIEMTAENGENYITVNNGLQIIVYDTVANVAQKMNFEEGELADLGSQSPKEQAEMMFNMVKDTHEISTVGEEKIAGRDTYHIVAKANETDTLLGDLEVWIDKKTWVTLKTKTITAGNEMITEYTKMDVDAKIDDVQFTIDIPDDAKVEETNVADNASEAVTLDAVKEQLGGFLMVPEVDGLALTNILLDKGLEERFEYLFEYGKNGLPAFSVTMFKVMENSTEIVASLGEKEIEVRGKRGSLMEQGNFRHVGWQENGYQYGIIIDNPEMTTEDILAYAEKMTVVQ